MKGSFSVIFHTVSKVGMSRKVIIIVATGEPQQFSNKCSCSAEGQPSMKRIILYISGHLEFPKRAGTSDNYYIDWCSAFPGHFHLYLYFSYFHLFQTYDENM